MFNNNVESDADFCEAYKSQILNDNLEDKESSFTSILTILLLLVIIIALSIYGYNYFMGSDGSQSVPSKSAQTINDDELTVKAEEDLPISPMVKDEVSKEEKKAVSEPTAAIPKPKKLDLDIDQIADEVKIAISQTEEKNISLTSKKEKVSSKESKKSTYVEALANESSVSNSNNSTYIEELEKLTAEIDKERD